MRRRPDLHRDDGFSLIELMVTMTIMSVVLVVVIGAIAQIYSAVTLTEATAVGREQLGNAFRRLDKELRYASWIAKPGQVGTRWYVEYALPTGCRQLKYDAGVITLAGWTLPSTTPGTPTTLATDLSLITGVAPFALYLAGTVPYASAAAGVSGVGRNFAPEHAQFRLQFNAAVGRVTLPFDDIFTAQNTTRLTSLLNDCSKGRPTS